MNINTLIQKPLISISTGKKYSLGSKIIVDKKFSKIYYLSVMSEAQNFYISTQKILSTGKNAITIHSDDVLIPENNMELKTNQFVINTKSEIYTYLGDFVATINNINIDKFSILSLSLLNSEKEVTKILSSGESIIIVDDPEKSYHKPKIKLCDISVKIC